MDNFGSYRINFELALPQSYGMFRIAYNNNYF